MLFFSNVKNLLHRNFNKCSIFNKKIIVSTQNIVFQASNTKYNTNFNIRKLKSSYL